MLPEIDMTSRVDLHRPILDDDIIVLIFEYAAQVDTTHYEMHISASQTCRQWRRVALNTAALWSRFDLVVDVRKWRQAPCVQLLQAWLARSKSCPLYFSVHFCANTLNGAAVSADPRRINNNKKEARRRETYAANVMQLLLACQSRWREAKVLFTSTGLRKKFTAKLHDTPTLEKLEVRYNVKGAQRPLFAEGPETSLVPIYALEPRDGVVFPCLKYLDLWIPGLISTAIKSLIAVLQHTPELRTLLVSHHTVDWRMRRAYNDLLEYPSLPHLREITWRVPSSFVRWIAHCIIVPALQELHVKATGDSPFFSVCQWLSVEDNASRLTCLHLDFTWVEEWSASDAASDARILSRVVSLERLHLTEPFVGRDHSKGFWTQFTLPEGSDRVGTGDISCPALVFLSVKFSARVPDDYEPFARMLASRARDERFSALIEMSPRSNVLGLGRERMVEEAELFRAACAAIGLPVVEVDGSALQFRIPA
ncbi:hypothetical protein BDW22DRAFT_1480823 [Trametopsis cervina]|nr:hypothetical protein BDW22DRAFT_1480823 [Trametopsis cervina]